MIGKLIEKTLNDILDFYENSEFKKEIYKLIYPEQEKEDLEDWVEFIRSNEIIPSVRMGTIDFYLFTYPDLPEQQKEILESIKNYSYKGFFEVIQKTGEYLKLFSLFNEKEYIVYPFNKMFVYRNVYKNNFIYGTLIKYLDKYYLLDSFAVQTDREKALNTVMIFIRQNPELIILDNPEKEKEVDAFIDKVYTKFVDVFGTDKVITNEMNYYDIGKRFLDFVESGDAKFIENIHDLITPPKELMWFPEFSDDEEDEETQEEKLLKYDGGVIVDKKNGLYVIDGYGTFLEIFKREDYKSIPNYDNCIKYYFESIMYPNIDYPHPVIVKAYNETEDKDRFLKIVKEALDNPEVENASFEELIKYYKEVKPDTRNFSQIMMPYISKTMKEVEFIQEKETKAILDSYNKAEKPEITEKIGRNDPCPCGSGKKYKKCCLR